MSKPVGEAIWNVAPNPNTDDADGWVLIEVQPDGTSVVRFSFATEQEARKYRRKVTGWVEMEKFWSG